MSDDVDVDPHWQRYLQGTKAFEALWATGARCPGNPDGVKCTCAIPKDAICKYWWALGGLAAKIGVAIKETFEKIK